MKIHATLGTILAAMLSTTCWAGQPSATVTLHWRNTQTGAQDPLLPGQTADIWLDVAFSPPVGTPSGNGTIAGLGSLFADLLGAGNAAGNWTLSGPGFAGTPEPNGPGTNINHNEYGGRRDATTIWVGPPPTPQPDGSLLALQAGQFPLSVASFNPVIELWRGRWQPAEYTPRAVTFETQRALASPSTGVSLLVALPGGIHETLHVDPANIAWGAVQIPIPGPSTLALLALTSGLALHRRRSRSAELRGRGSRPFECHQQDPGGNSARGASHLRTCPAQAIARAPSSTTP